MAAHIRPAKAPTSVRFAPILDPATTANRAPMIRRRGEKEAEEERMRGGRRKGGGSTDSRAR